ncbi:MAG: tetratricopeptide repeat protein [Halobacteriaceae archaeon]
MDDSDSRDPDGSSEDEALDPSQPDDPDLRDHEFSAGQGFEEPYEGFDLDPPELEVDPEDVDPVDSRVVGDLIDERQLADDEVDADALVDVGLEYIGINRHEQAADALERAARYADDEDVAQEAWVNKGVAHAELEEWDRAIGAYREAIDVAEDGPHVADAQTNLAYALWEFGEDEEAFYRAEEAVRTDDRLPAAWYNLGFIQNERGHHEDALDCLENAQRLGLRNAAVHEERARALEALGREEAAEDAAERARELQEQVEDDLVER